MNDLLKIDFGVCVLFDMSFDFIYDSVKALQKSRLTALFELYLRIKNLVLVNQTFRETQKHFLPYKSEIKVRNLQFIESILGLCPLTEWARSVS